MFDFLDEDWFIIGLEIVFLVFIAYDIRNYMRTKKREFLLNIALAIGFALWILVPYYTKYFNWEPQDREVLYQNCLDHNSSKKLCKCMTNAYELEYSYEDFVKEQNSSDFITFTKETKADCIDNF